jgi:hypothetical protein
MVAKGDETHKSALKMMQARWKNPLKGIVFYKIKGAHLGKKLLLKRSPPHSVFSVR